MTENDKLFLGTLFRLSENNAGNLNNKKSITTNKALLSEELLKLLGIDRNSSGEWVGNVYVEFEPMFKELPAKDWQKERPF